MNPSGTPGSGPDADGGGRRRRATVRLRATAAELMRLDAFVRALSFLSVDERDRLLIVASEIFDNVISYSDRLRCRAVTIRVSKGAALRASFFFKSSNFSVFARSERDAEKRYFDEEKDRYRGLGLTMCRNLTSSMRFRPGLASDAITVVF